MSDDSRNVSLIEVVKRNGDFRKNYGRAIGAFLFLRAVSAARGRTVLGSAMAAIVTAAFAAGLQRYGWHIPF